MDITLPPPQTTEGIRLVMDNMAILINESELAKARITENIQSPAEHLFLAKKMEEVIATFEIMRSTTKQYLLKHEHELARATRS